MKGGGQGGLKHKNYWPQVSVDSSPDSTLPVT